MRTEDAAFNERQHLSSSAPSTRPSTGWHRFLNADAMLVLVTILAALGWLFSRHALKGMPPLHFMATRLLLAGGILAAFGWRQIRELSRRDLIRSCGSTGIAFGIGISLWILALQNAKSMGVGAFITSLGVVFAPLVAWLMFRVRVTAATWLAVAIATAGMACLSFEKGLSLSLSDLFFVGCAVAFSVQFNLNSRFAARIPALPLTAVQLVIAGVFALILSLMTESWPSSISAETAGWLAASIVLSTCGRFFLQVKGQSMASVSHAALIMTLEPVWTALLAATLLGERMTAMQIFGCVLIMLALLVNRVRWTLRQKSGF